VTVLLRAHAVEHSVDTGPRCGDTARRTFGTYRTSQVKPGTARIFQRPGAPWRRPGDPLRERSSAGNPWFAKAPEDAVGEEGHAPRDGGIGRKITYINRKSTNRRFQAHNEKNGHGGQ